MNKKHAATKRYLWQIRNLDRALDRQLLEVARLRAKAANVGAAMNGDRVQVSPTNILEEMIVKITEEEQKADGILDMLIDRKNKIICQINKLTNDDSIEVLKLYFIDFVKFDDIPEKANMSRRKVIYDYNRGLEEFEKLHGHMYLTK